MPITCLECNHFCVCRVLSALARTQSICEANEALDIYQYCAKFCDFYEYSEEVQKWQTQRKAKLHSRTS